jgi:protein phosphatase
VLNLAPLAQPTVSPSPRVVGSPAFRVALVVVLLGIAAAVARRVMRRASAGSPASKVDPERIAIEEVEPTTAHAVPIVLDADIAAPELAGPMVRESAFKHDIGRVKPTNQDAYLLDERHGLFAIADGIGGNAGGDVASATAIRTIEECFNAGRLKVGPLTHLPRKAAELANAVYAANNAIRRGQAADWNISEMGTTCVVARFCPDEQRVYIAHIGDSRAYRLRGGAIAQLTTDHTMAELGLVGPRANHLSRALGSDPCPKIDVLFVRPLPGDVYLLCSDGLTKMMTVEQLTGILEESGSADKAVASLVDLANSQGGQDNITVVVVRIKRP